MTQKNTTEHVPNIDWDEVEAKINIICNKFQNLKRYRADLAQELRIHAYFVSDDYYNLYRRAIDFYRHIQTKESPDTPYFDLEFMESIGKTDECDEDFHIIVGYIKKELRRPGLNKWDEDMLRLAEQILDIILSDIDPNVPFPLPRRHSNLLPYRNEKLNLSWVAEVTGINYKRISTAMRFIEDTVRGLAAMNKIEIPTECFKGYYE